MDDIDGVLAVAHAHARTDEPAIPENRPALACGLRVEPPHRPTVRTDTDEEPRLWPEIRMMIETGIRDQPRERQAEIGPSELGTDCLHCLAAKLAGWPQTRQISWLPFIGTCVHEHFEREFRDIDQTVNAPDGTDSSTDLPRFETEMKVNVGKLHGIYGSTPLHGSIDLYDRYTCSTVDWKITGDTTMKNAKANGPSQQYRVQASLYGIGLENAGETCRRNCIYMLPRNRTTLNDAYAWETPFDPKPGRWAMGRAQLLINLMDSIELEAGPDVRDAWIHTLPKSPTHCFQCGTWPDDNLGTELAELQSDAYPPVPDKWRRLLPLLEPTYEGEGGAQDTTR